MSEKATGMSCPQLVVKVGLSKCTTVFYRSVTKETVRLIASMVYSPSSELNITVMDIEKQSNGSDCGVLAIAYAFDIIM